MLQLRSRFFEPLQRITCSLALVVSLIACREVLAAQTMELALPPRDAHMESGSEFARRIADLTLADRDASIEQAILAGNVPSRLRHLQPVRFPFSRGGSNGVITLFVAADYLSVGSDEDWLLVPMAPFTAQRIADRLNCLLPTPRIVNVIHSSASVQLPPKPIPPGPAMTTVPVFAQHTAALRTLLPLWPGALVAGHKKDVVIVNRLTNALGKVAIYGWHRTNGEPIQPLYLGHLDTWVDYSHGIRLVSNRVLVDDQPNLLAYVLKDPALASAVSDEGVVPISRYGPVSALLPTAVSGETLSYLDLGPSVRAMISKPSKPAMGQAFQLILYALPNGNTIEQSFGKAVQPGDDWHFGIQHIGAQTRFVRERDTNHARAVVYLEAEGLAWPAWRKKHPDGSERIVKLVERCAAMVGESQAAIVLVGHSGGGSFIFGYLNGVSQIPETVERIAFLDANYAYDPALGHDNKLLSWLKSSTKTCVSVFAYNDAVALLDGKSFVSASGGTWGRSHLMLTNFTSEFPFDVRSVDGLSNHRALRGRVQFLLKENPEGKILHTVQVERNGFIHALLSGTPLEEQGYRYFGPRAYEKWIR